MRDETTLKALARLLKRANRVTDILAYQVDRPDGKFDALELSHVLPTAYGNQFRHSGSDFLDHRNLDLFQLIQVDPVNRFATISKDVHGVLDSSLRPVAFQSRAQTFGSCERTLCKNDRNINRLIALLPFCVITPKNLKVPQTQRYHSSGAGAERRSDINPVFFGMKRSKWPNGKCAIAKNDAVGNKHHGSNRICHGNPDCFFDRSTRRAEGNRAPIDVHQTVKDVRSTEGPR